MFFLAVTCLSPGSVRLCVSPDRVSFISLTAWRTLFLYLFQDYVKTNNYPWAANDPDLKLGSSIQFSSILCREKKKRKKGKPQPYTFLEREMSPRVLFKSLKSKVFIFLHASVEEYQYCCDGMCSMKGMGNTLCFFLPGLLSPHFSKRCPPSPLSIDPSDPQKIFAEAQG